MPEESGFFARARLLTLVLLAATALSIYVCYLIVRPFFPALAWALAFAVIAHPLHRRLCGRLRPTLASLATVAVVAVVIVGPMLFVARQLVQEAAHGAEVIKAETADGKWRDKLRSDPVTARMLQFADNLDVEDAVQQIGGRLSSVASTLVTGSLWGIVQLAIAMFVLFYVFRDQRHVMAGLRGIVPLSEQETDEVFHRIADTIHATVFGSVTVALVQGTLGGIIFALLGLPAPLLWATVMFVLCVIPTLGSFVIWGPTAIFLAVQGQWGKAIFLAVYGMTVIGLIDNLLYPVLVGHKLRFHPLPVFFSLVGGVLLFGASGIVLGPVVLAVTFALVGFWPRRTRAGQGADAEVEAPRVVKPPEAA